MLVAMANREDPDKMPHDIYVHGLLKQKRSSEKEIIAYDPSKYNMDYSKLLVSNQKE